MCFTLWDFTHLKPIFQCLDKENLHMQHLELGTLCKIPRCVYFKAKFWNVYLSTIASILEPLKNRTQKKAPNTV